MSVNANTPWTEERVQQLVQYWLDGLSASQISEMFGGVVSRNAVLGRLHRMKKLGRRGYSHKRTAEKAAEARARKAAQTQLRKLMVMTTPRPVRVYEPKPVVGEPAPLATIATDTGSGCRWICGDPRDASSKVCGHVRYARAWCEHHYHRAYTGETIAQAERRRARERAERAFADKVAAA